MTLIRRNIAAVCILTTSLFALSGCGSTTVGSSLTPSSTNSANGYSEPKPIPTSTSKPKPMPSPVASSGVPIRGIIEGFYGPPWTNQERTGMFQFMAQENLNTYVYAPKGDPYQRIDWRAPYPSAKLAQMGSLVAAANQHHVQFVYSISPGMTGLSSNDVNQSITYSSASDRQTLEAKINQLRGIGVHTFMLSFDDIETDLKPTDKAVYGTNYALAQMELANQVLSDERQQDPRFQLWFAPTSYYGLTDGPYWQTLRSTLSANIKVIWTGKWVLNQTISSTQAETITRLLGRKPLIWDNYPVNDYTYNPGKPHQLMLGPLQGRDATLLSHVSGYLSNPMLQPDASKLALATIADYLQNPNGYQPKTAWTNAIRHMPGVTNSALFEQFAAFNTKSILNPSGDAPTRPLISAFWNASSATERTTAQTQLAAEFRMLADLPRNLSPTITDKELLHEIQPWLTKLGEEGSGGLAALNVIDGPTARNKQELSKDIRMVTASPYDIGDSIITFMQKVENQN
ncbi:beta-N-acetylglucosaminidase domain-containing protein [Alicyclobacillus curvatus]|nr:beta-N-acetylglucosaminidase domain-containing protein [Alicyclobacillus curvatus]